jgi:hypothetical protein
MVQDQKQGNLNGITLNQVEGSRNVKQGVTRPEMKQGNKYSITVDQVEGSRNVKREMTEKKTGPP